VTLATFMTLAVEAASWQKAGDAKMNLQYASLCKSDAEMESEQLQKRVMTVQTMVLDA